MNPRERQAQLLGKKWKPSDKMGYLTFLIYRRRTLCVKTPQASKAGSDGCTHAASGKRGLESSLSVTYLARNAIRIGLHLRNVRAAYWRYKAGRRFGGSILNELRGALWWFSWWSNIPWLRKIANPKSIRSRQ